MLTLQALAARLQTAPAPAARSLLAAPPSASSATVAQREWVRLLPEPVVSKPLLQL